jgi:RimJ/RimL family protein N-acetyltransferase
MKQLSTEAIEYASRHGATLAAADTDLENLASQRVLAKSGLIETARRGSLVYFERDLTAR